MSLKCQHLQKLFGISKLHANQNMRKINLTDTEIAQNILVFEEVIYSFPKAGLE